MAASWLKTVPTCGNEPADGLGDLGVRAFSVDAAETHAWIFLSIPEHPATVADIRAIADGINHAVPTQDELRQSFRWLQKRGFVFREGRRYALTEDGLALRRRTPKSIMKAWDRVAEDFRHDHGNI
jgi:hypothetical protein